VIRTNISEEVSVHDTIIHPSIESQVNGLFANKFATVTHKILPGGVYILNIDGIDCGLEVGKKGVKITVMPRYAHNHDEIRFGEAGTKYPGVKLGYNKDINAKVDEFCDKLRRLKDLEARAKALVKPIDKKKIEEFLNRELSTNRVQASYWTGCLFDGVEVAFYLHPKGKSPADGVIVCVEKDTLKITPFWNASTPRRTMAYNCPQQIENAVGKDYTNDVSGMKRKVTDVENVVLKVNAFDATKSQDFMALIEMKKQGDQLLAEFEQLSIKG